MLSAQSRRWEGTELNRFSLCSLHKRRLEQFLRNLGEITSVSFAHERVNQAVWWRQGNSNFRKKHDDNKSKLKYQIWRTFAMLNLIRLKINSTDRWTLRDLRQWNDFVADYLLTREIAFFFFCDLFCVCDMTIWGFSIVTSTVVIIKAPARLVQNSNFKCHF